MALFKDSSSPALKRPAIQLRSHEPNKFIGPKTELLSDGIKGRTILPAHPHQPFKEGEEPMNEGLAAAFDQGNRPIYSVKYAKLLSERVTDTLNRITFY